MYHKVTSFLVYKVSITYTKVKNVSYWIIN